MLERLPPVPADNASHTLQIKGLRRLLDFDEEGTVRQLTRCAHALVRGTPGVGLSLLRAVRRV